VFFTVSGFLFESLATARTFDADASLAPRNTDGLTAGWAGIIAILPIREEFLEARIGRGFPLTGGNVPGKHAVDTPDHQRIGKDHKERQFLNKTAEDAQHKAGAKQQKIQFIRAVTAVHKDAEPLSESAKHRGIPPPPEDIELLYLNYKLK